MTSIIKVDTIQTAAGGTPTAASLGIDLGNVGKIGQVISSKFSDNQSTTSTSFTSTNYTLSLTPSSTSSKILARFTGHFYIDGNNVGSNIGAQVKLFRTVGGTSTELWYDNGVPRIKNSSDSYLFGTHQIEYLDSPNTTSSVEYRIHIAVQTSGMVFALPTGDGDSSATLMEVLA